MSEIWKFQLREVGGQYVKIPKGAVVLSAQIQGEAPKSTICIWAFVPDTHASMISRRFEIIATGQRLEPGFLEKFKFVGTVQMFFGGLVFHVFDGGDLV